LSILRPYPGEASHVTFAHEGLRSDVRNTEIFKMERFLPAMPDPALPWEFWLDVGGTFTDCLGRSPDGQLITFKTLSSGVTKGRLTRSPDPTSVADVMRQNDPPGFWKGYQIRFLDAAGIQVHETRVTSFTAQTGTFELAAPPPPTLGIGTPYELLSGEEAPLVAIRSILRLRLDQPIPPMTVKLGTTRGTNALLTRRGARTAFVTTAGFADVLRIANQDRPRLFDLAIQKPEPLFEQTVEIDERIDVHGRPLRVPDEAKLREQFTALRKTGVESLGICLLHAFVNPAHEQIVERVAREAGFEEISTSSRLAPLIKIVSRGDTTVMDAYLNPILRDYVGKLRGSLFANRPASEAWQSSTSTHSQSATIDENAQNETVLKLMTSAGGLIDADRFVGKDSILSGPAGGVVGFSRVAREAGFEKSIGFDMGGTSTDVSRFDGRFELEFETKKAGVRVVAPMMAIETVAAGGGSICDFDGVKLIVGPNSAGADPGPACYGRGGPLTVTDLNVFLGKIVASRFPFPLDFDAITVRLQELCERIAKSPTGRQFSPVELADGLLKIANANMVRPIRNISVAKGYDPADYVLVCFGGAGGQHACAVARALGMRRILIHPYAGILSAYGIGLADVRRFAERAVLRKFDDLSPTDLDQIFGELEDSATKEVAAEGIAPAQILPPIRSLDIRYQGVESAIHVVAPPDGDFRRRYEELHEQLYGYRHRQRGLEIVAARVEVVGVTADPPFSQEEVRQGRPQPVEQVETWFEGVARRTGVFVRADLRAGDEISGPAIVCEPTSTVMIDPGFEARILARGELLITDSAGGHREEISTEADPVMLEIFNNLFASIAEQMGTTLQRISLSTNVKERLDFSCAVFDPRGDLVVNAPHIPVHLGAMSETVKRIIADNPRIAPGDVFVTNDPYRGGSHLPDVTVVSPVHHQNNGEILFFTASRAHHAEIGGIVPGSMPPFSKNLGEEGVLIRNFRLVDQGVSREEELRELLLSGPYPTRSVGDNLADVAAQVAANNVGVKQLRDLASRYGLKVVQAYMGHIQSAAAAKMRLALSEMPSGVYERTEHLDDGSPIAVRITIEGDTATVDFAGTGAVLASNLNANRAIVSAAVLYVFRCLIRDDIPLNSGVLDPVTIILPECLLNPPEHATPAQSAAVVGGNVETSQRVVDTLLGALGVAAASQGTMNNLTFGDATFGYYETICGGSGATPEAAGADAVHTHMTNTRLTDVEVIERRYPVRIHEFSIRRGSGGAGRNRGGDGIVRKIEFLKPVKVSMLSERRGPFAPFGLNGGAAGALGRNTFQPNVSRDSRASDILAAEDLTSPTGERSAPIDLGGKFAIDVQPGDLLTIETPGGGGYGSVEP